MAGHKARQSEPLSPDLVECRHCDFRLCVHRPGLYGAYCPTRSTTFSGKSEMLRAAGLPHDLPCPGCGAPAGSAPAGPCENHGKADARAVFEDEGSGVR